MSRIRVPRTEPSESAINTKRETLELVRAYYKSGNDNVRRQIRDMVRVLAARTLLRNDRE